MPRARLLKSQQVNEKLDLFYFYDTLDFTFRKNIKNSKFESIVVSIEYHHSATSTTMTTTTTTTTMMMTMRPRIRQVITTQTQTRSAAVFSHNRIGSTINTPTSTTTYAASSREHRCTDPTTLKIVFPAVATIGMHHRRQQQYRWRSSSSSSSTISSSLPLKIRKLEEEEERIKVKNENEEEIITRNNKNDRIHNTNAVTNSKKTNKTKQDPEDQVTTSNTSSSSSSSSRTVGTKGGDDEEDEAQLNWKERKQAPTWMQKIAPTKGGKWPPKPHEVMIMMSGLVVFVWSWTS